MIDGSDDIGHLRLRVVQIEVARPILPRLLPTLEVGKSDKGAVGLEGVEVPGLALHTQVDEVDLGGGGRD